MKIAFCTGLLTLILLTCYSQSSQIDSLKQKLASSDQVVDKINTLLELVDASTNINYDQSLDFGQQALELAKTTNHDSALIQCYVKIGRTHLLKGDYSQALELLEAGRLQAEIHEDSASLSLLHNFIAQCYFYTSDYANALEHFLQVPSMITDKNSEALASVLNNIGSVHEIMGNNQSAREYYQRSLAIHRNLDNPEKIAGTLTNIGVVYYNQKQYDSALYVYQQAEAVADKLDRPLVKSVLYENMGNVYREQAAYDESADYYAKGLMHSKAVGDDFGIASIYRHLGHLYFLQKKYREAISYLDKTVEISKTISAGRLLADSYELLSLTHAELRNYEQALQYQKQYSGLKDSLMNEEKMHQIVMMEKKFKSEQQKAEISRLEKANMESELSISRAERRQTLLLATLVTIAATLIGFYLFYRFRQQRRIAAYEADRSQKLQRLDTLKDQFLANTSHELRTPLQGIIGLSESLEERVKGGDQREDLKMIISSGKRLSSLVNDILDFSKLRNHELQLSLQPVDVRAATNVVLSLSKPLIKHKSIDLINSVPGDIPLVQADENRLQQILHNLIGNAIKFTEKGEIEVTAKTDNGFLSVMIRDTGIGIPEESQEAIFNSFQQVEDSLTREYTGTGIGLTVTKHLVELHGGTITVSSTDGKGSIFCFTLPLSPSDAKIPHKESLVSVVEAPNSEESYKPTSHPKTETRKQQQSDFNKILVVDDEPVNLRVLENHLHSEGYQVITASDGEQALEILQGGEDFDLCILDIMMPKISGFEVCNTIRQDYLPSELPVILLTAKNRVADLVEGFSLGANDYLTKPFSKDELTSRVRTHLNLHLINKVAAKFIPTEFLRAVGRDSITEVQLGDHTRKHVTVFFSDIRDYTALAEKMSPEENFKFIGAYVGLMGPIIRNNGGFVNQYYGDGIMAIFPESSHQALKAAVEMQLKIQEYNLQQKAKGKKPLTVGMGLHSGPLVMGIIGDSKRNEPSLIADTVNVASRMEGLTKHYGANIILSEACMKSIDDNGRYSYRFLGKVQVKGKSQVIAAYECFDGDESNIKRGKTDTLERYENGLELFYRKEFADATGIFGQVLKANPKDRVALHFRDRAARYTYEGIPDNWIGVEKVNIK